MQTKYLGQFKLDYKINLDYEKDWNEVHKVEFEEIMDSLIPAYINVEDDSDYYETELFMRHSENIEELGEIHGIMGETNTSSNETIQIGSKITIITNCKGFLEPKSFREEFGEESLNGIIIDIDFSKVNPYGVSFANGYSVIWLTPNDFEIKENKC